MSHFGYKLIAVFLLLLFGEAFSQSVPIPDSIKERLADENAILSIEEAYTIRTAMRGDSANTLVTI